jgi:hypothetical protein
VKAKDNYTQSVRIGVEILARVKSEASKRRRTMRAQVEYLVERGFLK